ncbi:MAG: branched-chain amino acid ABC transporter [Sphingomonas sp. SCN 67-18]|uniref:branched-chain amino acid ABC transporter permease n=1 Tax=uncultured Sphingomonas sp. TaxID=158754 RepID=UPI00086C4BA5|nr:branched-chain amino acid ABC transporter permease [Sphingomonas sp. SCN 67-18]ODU22583.1 MAG: branched-chain amino acid ABC transporter [Sphingomonas sp. SCN 67-18]
MEPDAPKRPGKGAAIILTLFFQITVALFIYALLKAENAVVVALLLASLGASFWTVSRNPAALDQLAATLRQHRAMALSLTLLILLAVPLLVGSDVYILHLLILAQLYAVLALALNFQLGSANIPNFATSASYGIGAYASALLATGLGIGFWLAVPAAVLIATLLCLAVGLLAMRARDTHLALVTIAFAVVVHQLLNTLAWTGGANGLSGIPVPTLFGHSFADPLRALGIRLPSQANFYYLSAALLAVMILAARRLQASRVGLAWNAIRADEIAARAQGIDVTRYKVTAYLADAAFAALAGAIYAAYISYISPENFTFLLSVTIMTMVIVGGMDNIAGVLIGAFLITVLPEKLRLFSDYRLFIFAAIVIAFLLIRPQGLFPKRLRAYGAAA